MRNLRTIRIASQCVFTALFALTVLFVARQPLGYSLSAGWFFHLNPLVGLLTSLAARTPLWPALILGGVMIGTTMLLGRVFCGAMCPLGALIDFSDRYLFLKVRSGRRRPPRYVRRLKYVLLVGLVVLAAMGTLFALFFDPILLATRIVALLLLPTVGILAVDVHTVLRPLFAAVGADGLSLATLHVASVYGAAAGVVILGVVVVGGVWDRRFWCQYLCPSGAFFALLSLRPRLHRSVNRSRCGDCRLCAVATCPTRAIDDKNFRATSTAECVLCGLCERNPKGCTGFVFGPPAGDEVRGPDVKRRHVLFGTLGGIVLLPVLRGAPSGRYGGSGRLVRPPGAVPEEEFGARCLACGQCVRACPTTALQPCLVGDGLNRLFTPKLMPRIGGCEEKCFLCGHVCPTGAIRALSYEQKRFVKIGTAVIDRHRCLAWAQNKECVVCDEVCPYNAISTRYLETVGGWFRVPVVHEDLCLGCGLCEHHCPIFSEAAIVVHQFGEQRLSMGEYVSAARREKIVALRRRSDVEGLGRSFDQPSERVRPAGSGDDPAEGTDLGGENSGGLPPGFDVE